MLKRCGTLPMVLLLASILAGCGADKHPPSTAAASPPARPAPPPDTSTERLLAQPPEGWLQSFHTEGPGIRMVEYVPPDTDPNDWTDKLSFESFGEPPLPDPIQMLKSIADDQRKTCQKFSDHDTFSGVENDYPTSVRLFVCYKDPLTGKGQLTLVKTIRGDAHFYVITRAHRLPAIAPEAKDADLAVKQSIAQSSAYLHAISACDTASDRHPCPNAEVADASDTPNAGDATHSASVTSSTVNEPKSTADKSKNTADKSKSGANETKTVTPQTAAKSE